MPRAFLVKKYPSENHWSANKWAKLYDPGQSSSSSLELACRSFGKSPAATTSATVAGGRHSTAAVNAAVAAAAAVATSSTSSVGNSSGGNSSSTLNGSTNSKAKEKLNTIVDRLLHRRQLLNHPPLKADNLSSISSLQGASLATNGTTKAAVVGPVDNDQHGRQRSSQPPKMVYLGMGTKDRLSNNGSKKSTLETASLPSLQVLDGGGSKQVTNNGKLTAGGAKTSAIGHASGG